MKPIVLTADEVRAALAGALTELRRPMKEQPTIVHNGVPYRPQRSTRELYIVGGPFGGTKHTPIRGPFGAPGALLWVRETYARLLAVSPATGEPIPITAGEQLIKPPTQWTDSKGATHWNYDGKVIAYRANSDMEFCDGDGFSGEMADRSDMPQWRSPATMPLAYSRLTLVTRAVRVEFVGDVWTWIASVEILRRDGQPIPPREVQS